MDVIGSTMQYLFRKGITELKQEGYDATISESSNNLIGMNDVDILNKEQITKDICINTLSYLMFLTRNRTDDIKVRGCANSRLQREYISKEESSSSTVSTYALFISWDMVPI